MWGVVKALRRRGFGFISPENLRKDIFFHATSLQGVSFEELRVGDVLEFTIAEGEQGASAVNVQRNGGPWRQDELQIITSDSPVAIESEKTITRALIERLNTYPHDLYQLHPETFEQLIVEIFMSEGYTAERIRAWNQADGGIDIIASKREIGGFQIRHAIQCKRYAASRRVTATPIRSLVGVLDHFHAHVGVIATTSFFTKPARDEVQAHLWKINLVDFNSIVAALKKLELLAK